jgi:putative acetyltransferase
MEIRRALDSDQKAVEEVVAAAFEEPDDGRTVALVRALDASAATRASLVAVEGGRVIGHVQLSRCWLDARTRLVEVLVLSPLSVAPDKQRQGIGTALVAAAIAAAGRLGAPALFLEGGWDYYGRRGFSAAAPLGFSAPSDRIPGPVPGRPAAGVRSLDGRSARLLRGVLGARLCGAARSGRELAGPRTEARPVRAGGRDRRRTGAITNRPPR